MHGRGSYKWPNGDNYIGEYHNGLRNGYGEMIYHSKNEHYKGRWQDGLYHGQGQYWYAKSLQKVPRWEIFYGTGYEVWAGFWPVGITEKKRFGPTKEKKEKEIMRPH